jgi:hypothetical protein
VWSGTRCRDLEVAKLNQELQRVQSELKQLYDKRSEGDEKLMAVGSMRKEKELKQLQSECEMLKAEVARLENENEALQLVGHKQSSRPGHLDLPIAASGHEEQLRDMHDDPRKPEDLASAVPQETKDPELEAELAGSMGSNTIKSSISELTKSQKLIIENASYFV